MCCGNHEEFGQFERDFLFFKSSIYLYWTWELNVCLFFKDFYDG